MKKITLSIAIQDLNFVSKAQLVSQAGMVYHPYNILSKDGGINIIEDILNNAKSLSRTMSVEQNGAKLVIGLLPEFGKCVFYTKFNERYYCNMKSTIMFDFENNGFTDGWTYDITNSMLDPH